MLPHLHSREFFRYKVNNFQSCLIPLSHKPRNVSIVIMSLICACTRLSGIAAPPHEQPPISRTLHIRIRTSSFYDWTLEIKLPHTQPKEVKIPL
ncbi:uncharacterized protein LY89DRAFT_226827 [Mollisia scopiformis]|uniref:Uncharacterized protein n=1 Tax=Mollisia scopiformis TaxID=149040 RepID=A0A194WU79_MOLSC|nr:uncharacterized protein LY89DRAFT_226827 [Mollisia scopiformis]KUJ11516.1 hypothetical protein LY89DRAFT_226827 [Mollisia scopiformis]